MWLGDGEFYVWLSRSQPTDMPPLDAEHRKSCSVTEKQGAIILTNPFRTNDTVTILSQSEVVAFGMLFECPNTATATGDAVVIQVNTNEVIVQFVSDSASADMRNMLKVRSRPQAGGRWYAADGTEKTVTDIVQEVAAKKFNEAVNAALSLDKSETSIKSRIGNVMRNFYRSFTQAAKQNQGKPLTLFLDTTRDATSDFLTVENAWQLRWLGTKAMDAMGEALQDIDKPGSYEWLNGTWTASAAPSDTEK